MKIESNYTVDTCFAELDQIRTRLNKAKKGFRDEKYSMLARSQGIIAKLSKNDNLRKKFIGRIKKERATKSKKLKFDLSLEVAVKASGQSRKLAQKYARSLDYLRELNIPVEDTIKVLKSKGGVEATYNEYRKYQAEKLRAGADDSASPRSFPRPKAKAHPKDHIGDDKNGANKKKAGTRRPSTGTDSRKRKPTTAVERNNDRLVEMRVKIKLSDRDQIIESDTGTEFTLSSVCVGEDDVALQIERVTTAADVDDDWQD
jgi:hypothetical protein